MKPILINTVVMTLAIPDTAANMIAAVDRLILHGSGPRRQICLLILPLIALDYIRSKGQLYQPMVYPDFLECCLPDGQYGGSFVYLDSRVKDIEVAAIACEGRMMWPAWGQLVIMESADGRTQAGVPDGGRSEAEDAGGIREPESVQPGDMEALEVPGDTSGDGDPE